MKTFKDDIKMQLSRLIAGGLISLFTMFLTWAITPVKVIVKIPQTLEQMQNDFSSKQSSMLVSLHKQREADSLMFSQICQLQAANLVYQREIGIVKSKVNAVAGEFPELHRRFADIEEAVSNQNYEVIIKPPTNTNNLNYSSIWQMKNH
jgi:hypothetical protein